MTPLELFEAIGNMDPESIQDSIQLCLEDTLASEAEQENKAVRKDPLPAKVVGIHEQSPIERKYGITLLSFLLTAGCTAACIAGFALLIRFMGERGISTQSGSTDAEVTEVMPAATEAPAVTTGAQQTTTTAVTAKQPVQTVTAIVKADRQQTTNVTAGTETRPTADTRTAWAETAAPETETAAPATAPQNETTETQTETTAPEPPAQVYEMGDVDMDGQITFVDAALVSLDYKIAVESVLPPEKAWMKSQWERSPLTPEQQALGNVNGADESLNPDKQNSPLYPLSENDADIIYQVALLRNWYQIDATTEQYAADPNYYDEQVRSFYQNGFYASGGYEQSEWQLSQSFALGLLHKVSEAGFYLYREEYYKTYKWIEQFEYDTKEERDQYMVLIDTTAEFDENMEVLKETIFRHGWRGSVYGERSAYVESLHEAELKKSKQNQGG